MYQFANNLTSKSSRLNSPSIASFFHLNSNPVTETGTAKDEIIYRYTLFLRENQRILGNDKIEGRFSSTYVEKSNFYNREIKYTGKDLARFTIEEWQKGTALAILNLDQKKLIIEELLESGIENNDLSLIESLIEQSEEVHTYKLLNHFHEKSKGGTYKLNSKLIETVNRIKVNHEKSGLNIPSNGTWSSDNLRMVFERTYVNAMRHLSHHYDKENDLDCLTVFRLVTLQQGYKKTYPEIAERWKELGDKPNIIGAIKLLQEMKLAHTERTFYPDSEPFDARTILSKDYPNVYKKWKNDQRLDTLRRPKQDGGLHENKADINSGKKGNAIEQYIKGRVKSKDGWFLFALSPMDAFHTITLAVNVRGGNIFCYFLDQLNYDKPNSSADTYGILEGTAPGLRQVKLENVDEYMCYTMHDWWYRMGWLDRVQNNDNAVFNHGTDVTVAELSPNKL